MIIIITGGSISAQSFTIIKGELVKEIETSEYLELGLIEQTQDVQCCHRINIFGHLLNVSGDSLRIQVIEMNTEYKAGKNEELAPVNYQANSLMSITIEELYYIRKYKSKKSLKRKDSFKLVSLLSSISGISTLINAIVVSGEQNKSNLLISGASQIGLGIISGIFAYDRNLYFQGEEEIWSFK